MSTALEVQRKKVASIRTLFENSKGQIAMALPRHMTADRMLRVAMTSIQRNPDLLECTQQSLIACVMTAAQLGLEVDGVTGQAYLIPYGKVCTLIPGYQGLMSLARRSGEISTISAEVVYQKDTYRVVKGLEPILEHIPYSEDEPGEMVAVYAVVRLKDGGVQFEWMWKWQVERIRRRSRAAEKGPWKTDYDAMAKKTVIRQICKMLPKSVELATAIGLDERAEIGIDQNLIIPDQEAEIVTEDEEKPKSKLDAVVEQKKAKAEPTVDYDSGSTGAATIEPEPVEKEWICSDQNYSRLMDTIQMCAESGLPHVTIQNLLEMHGASKNPNKIPDEKFPTVVDQLVAKAKKQKFA